MIIARVEGGLGNQLFIYACARTLALRKNRALLLDVGNAGYAGADPFRRNYQLDQFPIRARIAKPEETQRFRRGSRSFYWLKKLSRWIPLGWNPLLEERGAFDSRFTGQKLSDPLYIIGYWQDERYFIDKAEEIASELSPVRLRQLVNAEECQLVASEDAVVLHVRRDKFPKKLSADYYSEALKVFQLQSQGKQVVVFGDSFEWARETLHLPTNTIYIDRDKSKSDLADFYLMSCARRLIIANSTFSWWAAWFAKRNGAQVIAPAVWGYPANPSESWQLIAPDKYHFD